MSKYTLTWDRTELGEIEYTVIEKIVTDGSGYIGKTLFKTDVQEEAFTYLEELTINERAEEIYLAANQESEWDRA